LTDFDRLEEVRAIWHRAMDSLDAAQTLLDNGHADFAASRAYYAAFYAACASLLSEGHDFSKHSAVLAAVHKEFVRTGRLEAQHGRVLDWLFELRNIGDYGELQHVTDEQAREAIAAARRFVEACKGLTSGDL
jgi:uncharacterized protein (UPF0332 family)